MFGWCLTYVWLYSICSTRNTIHTDMDHLFCLIFWFDQLASHQTPRESPEKDKGARRSGARPPVPPKPVISLSSSLAGKVNEDKHICMIYHCVYSRLFVLYIISHEMWEEPCTVITWGRLRCWTQFFKQIWASYHQKMFFLLLILAIDNIKFAFFHHWFDDQKY